MDVLTATAPPTAMPMPALPSAPGGAAGFASLLAGLIDAGPPAAGTEDEGGPAVVAPDPALLAVPPMELAAAPPMSPPIGIAFVLPTAPAPAPDSLAASGMVARAAMPVEQVGAAALAATSSAESPEDAPGGFSFVVPREMALTAGDDARPIMTSMTSPATIPAAGTGTPDVAVPTAPLTTPTAATAPLIAPTEATAPLTAGTTTDPRPTAATPNAIPPAAPSTTLPSVGWTASPPPPEAVPVDPAATEQTAAKFASAALGAPAPSATVTPSRDTARPKPVAISAATPSDEPPADQPLSIRMPEAATPSPATDLALTPDAEAAFAVEARPPEAAGPATLPPVAMADPRAAPLEAIALPPPTAPEPPAPTRQPGQIPWPARQVAPFAVALALGPNDGSFNFTLDPGELGRVEVAIDRSGVEAHVSLRAERPETLALLLRDRAELERALTDAGLGGQDGRGPSLSFGLGGEGTPGRERRSPSGGPPRGGRMPADLPTPTRAAGPRGLLDLAV